MDQSYGVSQKANTFFSGLNSFYEKAAGTETGQKVVNFYTQTSRQVQDIHAEARRLAHIKKQQLAAQNAPHTTHEIAEQDTNIVDSTKVDPLVPEDPKPENVTYA
jgi:hypothetical protein